MAPRGLGVEHEGSRTWLAGVWDGEVGIGWDASQRALAIAMQHVTGELVDFDELLVRSGDAFAASSSDVYQDVTYLAGAVDVLTEAARSYGFDGQWRFPESFDEAREIIKTEIDGGRPIPAGGAAQPYGCPPWGLIVGYDSKRPLFCFAAYPGGTRWMQVRGDCGREETGPWNGRVRGLLRQQNRFWLDRPLFILGPAGTPPPDEGARALALGLAVIAMEAESCRINYWGGVTYHFGLTALEHLAQDLRTIDFPAILEAPQPEDAYDWYRVGGVIADCASIVMRGRRAAARVFCRWTKEDARLAPLGETIPLLEESADAAEAIWNDLTPPFPWEEIEPKAEDKEWRIEAADAFRTILERDRQSLRVIKAEPAGERDG